jgi:hypothetical protein
MTDTTFFGETRLAAVKIWLSEPQETNQLADGSVIKASLGDALWRGEATIPPAAHADIGRVEAKLAKLMRAGETALVYDARYNGPAADPGGLILGAATPTIGSLDGDNRRLTVTGLPAGYQLRAGDWIGWTYGSSPTRYALHRIETDATASGGGTTPLFAVEPFIRPGVSAGAAVVLVRPPAKVIVTAADYGQGGPVVSSGANFSFVQTFR